ncbi:hypothetical protein ACN47E_002678 [Coniothyrium glycines]
MDGSEIIPHNPIITDRKPNKSIPVPLEFRRISQPSEREILVYNVKLKTDCILVPRWEESRIHRFDIYGSASGVDKAVAIVNKWITNAHSKSKDASAWAKTPAFDLNQWQDERDLETENELKKEFLRPRPDMAEDAVHLPRVIVDWPQDLADSDIAPRDIFGNKLAALDEVRKRHEVWITLLQSNSGHWQFEILGKGNQNLDAAENSLVTMLEKAQLNTLSAESTLNMILDDVEGLDVILEEAEDWWPNRADKIVPRLLPSGIMYESGSFRNDGLHDTQLSTIQNSFIQALEKVRHKKGAYDFAIRLGCVVLGSSKMPESQIGKTFRKEDFLRAINSRVDLMIRKWALDYDTGCDVLSRMMEMEEFLEPTKNGGYFGHTPTTLAQTRPMFRGTWVFRDPSSSSKQPQLSINLFLVQVDWTIDEEGEYEKTDMRYYKLAPGQTGPTLNMDINLLELGESRGWYFGLESIMPEPRRLVSPILTGFAEHVSMNPKYDPQSAESFARWNTTPSVQSHLVNGRLDKIYSFGVRNTCYKVELAAMWYPQQKLPVWGIAMRHSEWATHLAELETLPIGCKAEWGQTLTKFLPDDGVTSSFGDEDGDLGISQLSIGDNYEAPPREGIRILMDKLLQLSSLISSVTRGGGVTV